MPVHIKTEQITTHTQKTSSFFLLFFKQSQNFFYMIFILKNIY